MEGIIQKELFKLKTHKRPFEKLSAYEITKAIKARYSSSGQWIVLLELGFGTGFSSGSNNHIDAMVFNCWPSQGMHRTSFEIKVSRSDFKTEMRNPDKRKNAVDFSNQFFFITPVGMLEPEDIPEECGLMEVKKDLSTLIKKEAPFRKERKENIGFWLSALRNSSGVFYNRAASVSEFKKRMEKTLLGFSWKYTGEELYERFEAGIRD